MENKPYNQNGLIMKKTKKLNAWQMAAAHVRETGEDVTIIVKGKPIVVGYPSWLKVPASQSLAGSKRKIKS